MIEENVIQFVIETRGKKCQVRCPCLLYQSVKSPGPLHLSTLSSSLGTANHDRTLYHPNLSRKVAFVGTHAVQVLQELYRVRSTQGCAFLVSNAQLLGINNSLHSRTLTTTIREGQQEFLQILPHLLLFIQPSFRNKFA